MNKLTNKIHLKDYMGLILFLLHKSRQFTPEEAKIHMNILKSFSQKGDIIF
jgi:hypothetical protein